MDGDAVGQNVMTAMLIYLYYCKIWLLRIDEYRKMSLNSRQQPLGLFLAVKFLIWGISCSL
jgi:hypothetical protein